MRWLFLQESQVQGTLPLTAFDVEALNIVSCSLLLVSVGHLLASVGGVDGLLVNMYGLIISIHIQSQPDFPAA
jgi:hypothetical protein